MISLYRTVCLSVIALCAAYAGVDAQVNDAFFAKNVLLKPLQSLYNPSNPSGGGFPSNGYLNTCWQNICSLRKGTSLKPVTIDLNGDTQIVHSYNNMDVYLSDMIYAKITNTAPQFSFSQYQISGTPPIMPECKVDYTDEIIDMYRNFDFLSEYGSRYLMKLNLLELLDETTYNNLRPVTTAWSTYLWTLKNFHFPSISNSYFATFKENGNECMMIAAAVALTEYTGTQQPTTWGDARTYLYSCMQSHYSVSDGGYGAGTHYLGYQNEVMLPFYYICYKCGWLKLSDPDCQIITKSGQWLLDILDPGLGYFPEIDDACGGSDGYLMAPYYDFIPCTLNYSGGLIKVAAGFSITDPRLKWLVDTKGVSNNQYPVDFLTYDPIATSAPVSWNKIYVHGGVGKINSMSTSDTVSLTLVTTKSSETPDLGVKGGSHNQQDHGHIELRRTTNSGTDMLLLDAQYSGFAEKEDHGEEALYTNHNTFQLIPDINHINSWDLGLGTSCHISSTSAFRGENIFPYSYCSPESHGGIHPCTWSSMADYGFSEAAIAFFEGDAW